jgi:hypothetical protein
LESRGGSILPRAEGQARVNRNWRFYFNIVGDTYIIRDIVPHPKK